MVEGNKLTRLTLEDAIKLFDQEKYEQCISSIEYYADDGDILALERLGLAFQLGLGVSVDLRKAVYYLTQAATLGSGVAAHNLGTLYATMPNRDDEKARQWFDKAKSLGFDPSTGD